MNPIILKRIEESDLEPPIKLAVKNILESEFDFVAGQSAYYDSIIKREIENAYRRIQRNGSS